jgi:WD40 repeat protein
MVEGLDFSADGRRLLVVEGTRVRVFAVGEDKELCTWEHHGVHVKTAQFSSDGKRVITAASESDIPGPVTNRGVRLWDVPSENPIWFTPFEYTYHALFSPDGRHVLAATKYQVDFLDIESGDKLGYVDGPGSIFNLTLSRDGTLLLAWTTEGDAIMWEYKRLVPQK